jgi:polyphosphate kinase
MPRNLDRRIELLVPVLETELRQRLIHTLDVYFRDTVRSWELRSNGRFRRREPRKNQRPFQAQLRLYQDVVEAVREAEQKRLTAFETHTPKHD